MAKCQRPIWTFCFILVWLLIIPGVLLTHLAVSKVVPAVGDFPTNLIKGFEVTFKFERLTQDAQAIKDASQSVIADKCNIAVVNLNTTCQAAVETPKFDAAGLAEVDTTAEKNQILKAFDNSLSIIFKVTDDKFFGIEQFQNSAKQLEEITNKTKEIEPKMMCNVAVPVFCVMFQASGALIAGKGEVDKGINQFKESDAVKTWDERKSILEILHAVPYILVIGMLFFTIFWWCGGICCCCRRGQAEDSPKGSCPACLALIPYAIFWLAAFILNIIVVVIGLGLTYGKDQVKIDPPVVRTKTNLEELVNHIQTEFSDFWNVVFKDLVDGLAMLMNASSFFVVACLLIALYSTCLCCCCPYRTPKEEGKSGS